MPKIIEFVGLPGCGKSTLARELISTLSKENVIMTYHDFFSKKKLFILSNRTIFTPFIFIYYLFRFNYWTVIKSIWQFARQYPINEIRFVRVIFLIRLYENIQKKLKIKCIIILDEGFIQFISSIPHDIVIKENELLQKLLITWENIVENTLFVDCRLSVEEDIDRIRKRNKNDRFKRIENDKILAKLLQIKEYNLDVLTKKIARKKVTLNMADPVDTNIKYILDKLN